MAAASRAAARVLDLRAEAVGDAGDAEAVPVGERAVVAVVNDGRADAEAAAVDVDEQRQRRVARLVRARNEDAHLAARQGWVAARQGRALVGGQLAGAPGHEWNEDGQRRLVEPQFGAASEPVEERAALRQDWGRSLHGCCIAGAINDC